jgi:hypothetical protein
MIEQTEKTEKKPFFSPFTGEESNSSSNDYNVNPYSSQQGPNQYGLMQSNYQNASLGVTIDMTPTPAATKTIHPNFERLDPWPLKKDARLWASIFTTIIFGLYLAHFFKNINRAEGSYVHLLFWLIIFTFIPQLIATGFILFEYPNRSLVIKYKDRYDTRTVPKFKEDPDHCYFIPDFNKNKQLIRFLSFLLSMITTILMFTHMLIYISTPGHWGFIPALFLCFPTLLQNFRAFVNELRAFFFRRVYFLELTDSAGTIVTMDDNMQPLLSMDCNTDGVHPYQAILNEKMGNFEHKSDVFSTDKKINQNSQNNKNGENSTQFTGVNYPDPFVDPGVNINNTGRDQGNGQVWGGAYHDGNPYSQQGGSYYGNYQQDNASFQPPPESSKDDPFN